MSIKKNEKIYTTDNEYKSVLLYNCLLYILIKKILHEFLQFLRLIIHVSLGNNTKLK